MKIELSKHEATVILNGLIALEKEAKELDMCMTEEHEQLKNKIKLLA